MDGWRQLEQHLPAIAFDAIRFGNGLLLLFLVFVPLERLFALRRQALRRPGWPTDLAYYFLSSLLPNRVLALLFALLVAGLAGFLPHGLFPGLNELPWWARFALSMLVAEIGFYWGHRWMHQNAWLWRFHALHHSAEQMDWLVNTRAHPVDLVFSRACGFVPLYLLGLAQAGGDRLDGVPLLVSLVGSAWGYVIHANLRWRWSRLQPWIATPAFHHWHHTRLDTDPRTCNYAALLPAIDRLFGTRRPDDGRWPAAYGIDSPTPPGLAEQLVQPFLRRAARPLVSAVPAALDPPAFNPPAAAPDSGRPTHATR